MTLPMVTLTGKYQTANSSPETGSLTFTPSVALQSASNSVIIPNGPVTATLDGTGAFTVSLLATDATGVTPTGWTYQVVERLGNTQNPAGRTYNIQLPQAQTPVDLSTISPVATAGTVSAFTPISVVRTITAATVTANPWDVLECNATSTAITVTLPAAVAGVRVTVKKTDSSANTVTISGTVDGATNPALAYQYGSMELVADGTAWIRAVRPSLGALVDYPATSDARYATPSQIPSDDGYHYADNNLLWATESPRLASASPSPSNGTCAGKLLLTRMLLRRTTVLSDINFGLAGVDTTGPLTNCYIGIYDSTGTLRASTADISSTLMGTATPKTIAFSSPYTAAAGEYFIAMLLNGTWTSALTFKSTGGGVTANIGLTAPHLNLSNYGTGQTTLPSSITLASQATNLITGGVGSTWYGIS